MPGSNDLPPDDGPDLPEDEVDFDDLPGMEPDEPPDAEPELELSEDPPDGEGTPVEGEQSSGDTWTDAELNEWYDNQPPDQDLGEPTAEALAILGALHNAYEAMGAGPDAEDLAAAFFGTDERDWHRLGPELKARYRRYVDAAPERIAAQTPPAGWIDPYPPDPPELVIIGSDGQPLTTAEPSSPKSKTPVLIGGGILGLVLVAFFIWWLNNASNSEPPVVAPPTQTSVDVTVPSTEPPPATEPQSEDAAIEEDSTPESVVCGADEELIGDECVSTAPLIPVTAVRVLTGTIETADIWNCANDSYLGPDPDAAPVDVELLLGDANADGSVPAIALFGPELVAPAVTEIYMRNGSEQSGFSSGGTESFCNYGIEPVTADLLQCNDSFAAVGTMPSDPTQAEDFGVSFYQPNSADPSLLTAFSTSASSWDTESAYIQVDASGEMLIGWSSDTVDESIPSLDSCNGTDEFLELLEFLYSSE
ncbi:MAG: hypothetical protein ACC652_09950 [Acidimicrobiales bacterium]